MYRKLTDQEKQQYKALLWQMPLAFLIMWFMVIPFIDFSLDFAEWARGFYYARIYPFLFDF